MKEFIEVISDYVKAYREMNMFRGSHKDDLVVAREYYQDKMTDPDLTLKAFLDSYYTHNA